MGINNRFLISLILALAIMGGAASSFAEEPKVCKPFRENSAVNPLVVSEMLASAEFGGLYRIQPSSSSFYFHINSIIGEINAEFRIFQGGISLLASKEFEQGPALLRIDTNSLKTDSFLARNLLKGKDFFDAENFPEVLFVSNDLRWTTPTSGVLRGDLTLRGVTREITFNIKLTETNVASIEKSDKIQIVITSTIQRSNFGMDAFPSLAEDTVELIMQVDVERYVDETASNSADSESPDKAKPLKESSTGAFITYIPG